MAPKASRASKSKTSNREPVTITSARISAKIGGRYAVIAAAIGSLVAAVATAFATNVFGLLAGNPTGSASSQSLTDPLSIYATWPLVHGCDGGTEVAMFGNTRDSTSSKAAQSGDRETLANSGGAAFRYGSLYLTFVASGDSVVQIMNVRPLFYQARSRIPSWIYDPQGACGDSYGRTFDLNLDNRTFVDRGIQGAAYTRDPKDPVPFAAALGPSFHVSRSDPAQVLILVAGCKADYEWGIQVTFVVGNREFVKVIGSAVKPFRTTGAGGHTIPIYSTKYDSLGHPVGLATAGMFVPHQDCSGQYQWTTNGA